MTTHEISQSLVPSNNAVIPFRFADQATVRTLNVKGEMWCVARDVVEAVDSIWSTRSIAHVPDQWKGMHRIHTPGGAQEMAILSEQGVYFYLSRSDKPKALPIQMWISGEVLPSIRSTGSYSLVPQTPVIPQTYAEALRLAADLAEKNVEQAKQLEEMRPAIEAFDRIATAEGSLCVTDAAKTLQIQPRSLFKYLRTNGWVYKRPGTNEDIGYQAKLQADLLEHKIVTVFKEDGSPLVVTQVRVTPKGLARLAKELNG